MNDDLSDFNTKIVKTILTKFEMANPDLIKNDARYNPTLLSGGNIRISDGPMSYVDHILESDTGRSNADELFLPRPWLKNASEILVERIEDGKENGNGNSHGNEE